MNVGTKVDSPPLPTKPPPPPTATSLPPPRYLNETKSFAWKETHPHDATKPPTPPFDFGDALPERVAASELRTLRTYCANKAVADGIRVRKGEWREGKQEINADHLAKGSERWHQRRRQQVHVSCRRRS